MLTGRRSVCFSRSTPKRQRDREREDTMRTWKIDKCFYFEGEQEIKYNNSALETQSHLEV